MLKKELEQELNRTKLILDYAREELIEKDKEIDRLNNIINELEKELKKGVSIGICATNKKSAKSILSGAKYYQLFILDYLKELKEGNKYDL